MRVVVANMRVHNPHVKDAAKVLAGLRPDIALVCEAYDYHDTLSTVGTVHGHRKGSHGERECKVVTGPGVTVEKSETVQLTKHVGGPSGHPQFWQDRWATVVWCRFAGQKILAVSWHGNAGIQSRTTGHVRDTAGSRQYALGMHRLAALIEREREAGWTPIVGGDANYRARKVTPLWMHSPDSLFGGLGLVVRKHGVDQIATDPKFTKFLNLRVIPKPPGCDHHWLAADLQARKVPVPKAKSLKSVTWDIKPATPISLLEVSLAAMLADGVTMLLVPRECGRDVRNMLRSNGFVVYGPRSTVDADTQYLVALAR